MRLFQKNTHHSWFLFTGILFMPITLQAQSDTLAQLFRNSYTVFESLRNDYGVYRDATLFTGTDYHPCSVASTGMGLISLCIADGMGWIPDAESQVLHSLKTITGHTPSFQPDRNAAGFFRHWIEMETGKQAWNSEYSTIDSGILTCGALFCKKYFCENDSIGYYADLIWNSTDWSQAIEDPETGGIYREMLPEGSGKANTVSLPFNEYIIVAWLAMQQSSGPNTPAKELWNRFYGDVRNLPTKVYQDIVTLTDGPDHFLSSFVLQFPYYLCRPFAQSAQYLEYLQNLRLAEARWWSSRHQGMPYLWGLGAGSSSEGGYHADALDNNPGDIFSPHIIAGFLPLYPQGQYDLIQMYKNGQGAYDLPKRKGQKILWRKSLQDPDWVANEIQGVDYALFLFGLATLPEFLGPSFFSDHHNYFAGPCPTYNLASQEVYSIKVQRSASNAIIYLSFDNPQRGKLKIRLLDPEGKVLKQTSIRKKRNQLKTQLMLTKHSQELHALEIYKKKELLLKQQF